MYSMAIVGGGWRLLPDGASVHYASGATLLLND